MAGLKARRSFFAAFAFVLAALVMDKWHGSLPQTTGASKPSLSSANTPAIVVVSTNRLPDYYKIGIDQPLPAARLPLNLQALNCIGPRPPSP